jgi:Putative metallopeptidase
MSKRAWFVFAALAALALPAFAADKPPLTDEQKAEAMDFAMHDAIFTLYHESGHLLIHELGLPVLGKEEDAADALAVVQIFKHTDDPDELYNTMNDVADGWYYSSLNMTDEDIDTYDDHSLDIQRANTMVCMMVGANPDEFGETADDYEMDADQQDACAETYQQAVDSWDKELEPYLAKSPGADIPVTYEKAGKYEQYADELKSRKILESLAEELRTNYALPGPVSIKGALCDEPNAFYDPETHSITYCYELAADMYQRAVDNIFSDETASDDESAGDAGAGDNAGGSTIPEGAKKTSGSKGG